MCNSHLFLKWSIRPPIAGTAKDAMFAMVPKLGSFKASLELSSEANEELEDWGRGAANEGPAVARRTAVRIMEECILKE